MKRPKSSLKQKYELLKHKKSDWNPLVIKEITIFKARKSHFQFFRFGEKIFKSTNFKYICLYFDEILKACDYFGEHVCWYLMNKMHILYSSAISQYT